MNIDLSNGVSNGNRYQKYIDLIHQNYPFPDFFEIAENNGLLTRLPYNDQNFRRYICPKCQGENYKVKGNGRNRCNSEGCGFRAGDYITLYMTATGKTSFRDTVMTLAGIAAPPITFPRKQSRLYDQRFEAQSLQDLFSILLNVRNKDERQQLYLDSRGLGHVENGDFYTWDFWSVKDQLLSFIYPFGKKKLAGMGLYSLDKDRLFLPFARAEHGGYRGMLFGLFTPGLDFPVSYSYRWYLTDGKPHKNHRTFSVGKPVMIGKISPESSHVLICEGEPDYLTFNLITKDFPEISVIGLPGSGNSLPQKLELEGKKVMFCLHDTADSRRTVAGCKASKAAYFFNEGRDANNIWIEGGKQELGHIITQLLEELDSE